MRTLLYHVLIACMMIVKVQSASADPVSCQMKADLVFVVDSSTSLRPSEFDLLKRFVDEVVQGLVISLDNVRVALIRFSTQADVISTLDQSTSNEAVQEVINNMAYKSGGTNTARGLQVARTQVLVAEQGDRSDVADVVVVLTDGRSWFPDKTISQARMLREEGSEVVTVGVGKGVQLSELEAMASGEVHVINSVNQLKDAVDDVRASVCTVAKEATVKLKANQSSSEETPTTAATTATATTTAPPTTEEPTSPPSTPAPTATAAETPTVIPSTSSSSSSSSSASSSSSSSISSTSSASSVPSSTKPPSSESSLPSSSSPPETDESFSSEATTTASSNPPLKEGNGTQQRPESSVPKAGTPPSSDNSTEPMSTALPPAQEGEESSNLTDCASQKIDLVFVQDASYSVSESSFQMAKTFVTDTIRKLLIGPDSIRVAIVRYDTEADVIARLADSSDVETVTDAVDRMEYKVGGTNTAQALHVVKHQVLNEARPDARSVVVVITDGASTSLRRTRTNAQKLRDDEVRLVWLYIMAETRGNFRREIKTMVQAGDTTLQVKRFDDLGEETIWQILDASCKDWSLGPSPTGGTDRFSILEMKWLIGNDLSCAEPEPEPTTSTEEPTITTEEPTTSTEEPTTSTEEPTTSAEERTTSAEETKTSTEEPDTPPESNNATLPRSKSANTATSNGEDHLQNLREPTATTATAITSSTPAAEHEEISSVPRGEEEREEEHNKGERGKVEGDGSWRNSPPKVIGTVVGVFGVIAVGTCIVLVALRKRDDKRRRAKQEP